MTKRYRVVARRFENFDIAYDQHGLPRRAMGKLFMAESVGDVRRELPYKDGSFDLVWCSYAPVNWSEFLRVAKPGGKIFVLDGDLDDQKAKMISAELGMKVICKEVTQRDVDKWRKRTDSRYRSAVEFVAGKKALVVKKPEVGK